MRKEGRKEERRSEEERREGGSEREYYRCLVWWPFLTFEVLCTYIYIHICPFRHTDFCANYWLVCDSMDHLVVGITEQRSAVMLFLVFRTRLKC